MSESIPRFDHRPRYRAIRREILDAIDRVLESDSLILGPQLRTFEQQIVSYLGMRGHGVGVASGTDALSVALRALEIQQGDEVITVSFTAAATVSAIRSVGATPVFCDIDPQTLMMDWRDAEKRISRHTRAIIPVHLYGNAVEMPAILKLAGGYGLRVIEDCAQSLGTLLNKRATGTWGDVGCFSFYPTKNLGAYGDAGLCFAADLDLAERMRSVRNYGFNGQASAHREGLNSRLDEVQAAILQVQLRYLPEYLQKRSAIAEQYRRLLPSSAPMPGLSPGTQPSHHLLVVQVANRQHVIEQLSRNGIGTGVHYANPVHLMRAYAFLGYDEGSLPHTELAARRVLSLPCYPELPKKHIERICSVLNDACEQ